VHLCIARTRWLLSVVLQRLCCFCFWMLNTFLPVALLSFNVARCASFHHELLWLWNVMVSPDFCFWHMPSYVFWFIYSFVLRLWKNFLIKVQQASNSGWSSLELFHDREIWDVHLRMQRRPRGSRGPDPSLLLAYIWCGRGGVYRGGGV